MRKKYIYQLRICLSIDYMYLWMCAIDLLIKTIVKICYKA